MEAPLSIWCGTPATSSLPRSRSHGRGVDRDRDVVQPAEHLGVGAEVEPREVEEGEQVAVADVEEEVVGALVVAVLEDLRQRELEQLLVEGDRPLHVRRQQGDVVQTARTTGRPVR